VEVNVGVKGREGERENGGEREDGGREREDGGRERAREGARGRWRMVVGRREEERTGTAGKIKREGGGSWCWEIPIVDFVTR
jgi:hypothetical protein